MLDDMVSGKLITYEDAQIYQLFAMPGAAKEWFDKKKHESFMDEVPLEHMTADKVVFVDGRRSIFREIFFAIEHVQIQMRKFNDDARPAAE